MRIRSEEEDLTLLPEKAILWSARNTLILTDTHFGKTASFRKAGIPVPEQTTQDDLERLSSIVDRTGATRLLLLGDFMHARTSRQEAVLTSIGNWRRRYSELIIDLVQGNHDRSSGPPLNEWKINYHLGPLLEPPFLFSHDPLEEGEHYVMSGHIHPAVTLWDGTHRKVRLPCFSFGPRQALLPAFGSFTGTYEIEPQKTDRIFVIAEDEVIEVGN